MKITELAVPTDARPTPEIVEVAELHRHEMVSFFDHDDLVESPEAMARQLATQVDMRRIWLAAHDQDGTIRGAALATLPQRDNTTVSEIGLIVDPDVDPAPVAGALWEALAPQLTEAGRTVAQIWQMHRDGGQDSTDADRLVPATGSGSIIRDRWCDAMAGLGFTFEQAERHSVLDLADHRDEWPALAAEAAHRSGGYELVTWSGATPDELRAALAQLRNRMSVDVPSGALELEQEDWDADRVRRRDELAIAKGRAPLYAAARQLATGDLVAYTELELPSDHPQAAWQEDTLVHGDHRGRRLGLAVKLANLDQLTRVADQVQRIHTWNADENQWMLAINIALGFRPASAEGGWQRRL